ncbi:MAG: hypothetical protein L6R39_007069 [Caloplaca ligustica]|nr:MAG: hypothetical protein L6R39_007069 [Caloplaca ligustica]
MLRTPLAAPSVTGLRKRAPISVVVTTQLYTLKYSLKPQKSGLSAGAKAGIGVGVTVVAIFGALLVSLIIHKRKLRSQSIREGTIIGDGNWYGPPRSDTFSNVGGHLSHPGDLPSPTSMRQMPMGGGFWMPPTAPQRPPTPPPAPVPMQELPASTHIHEHHPAFQSSEHDSEHEPEPHPVLATHHNNEPSNSGGLVSSTEESDRK